MPRILLDPKDRKQNPTGLRLAGKNKKWAHVDRVGDWGDVVPSKKETTVLRDDEKASGLVKLDQDVKFRDGKLEVSVKEVLGVAADRVSELRG